MCTLTLAWQCFEAAPIVAAANRDELLDRPSRPPTVEEGELRTLAPRDAEAGGTWIGVNERGVFAGITNRWVDADLAGERSRGLLLRDVLDCESAEAAGRRVERAAEDDEYDGFNLVIADEGAALYYEWDGRLRFRNFGPGVHVAVNVGADGQFVVPGRRSDAGERQAESAGKVRSALAVEPGESPAEWRDRAAGVLADHEYGVCVHGDGFGTRSSSLVTVREDGTVDYAFADGPPCETDYEPVGAGFPRSRSG